MTEQNTETTESTESTETTETTEGTTDFVEMDPKVEARFKRIYGNMKQYERALQISAQNERKLIEKLEQIENSAIKRDVDTQIGDLKKQEKKAMEEGDYDAASNVRDKITELRVEAKTPKPAKTEEAPPARSSADPLLVDLINDWANEKDGSGDLVRPWAQPGHDDYDTALALATGIIHQHSNAAPEEIVAEIDRRSKKVFSKPAPKRETASVLSGAQHRPKQGNTMTGDHKAIARAMYPNLKPAEAEKRYAAAMEKYA